MESGRAGRSTARASLGNTTANASPTGARTSTSYRQEIQETMAVLNGQWVVSVLSSLAARPLKYLDLLEDINSTEERLGWISHSRPLSQKVLSETLKRMRRDGLVVRSGSGSAFREVWYGLSPLGENLLRALRSLASWTRDNREAVARARVQFDTARDEP
jgi:DNA-binding HxlR family transcriptional regulator